MAEQRPFKRKPGRPQPGKAPPRKSDRRPSAPGALTIKPLGRNRFAFSAPRCALERDLDLEGVEAMRNEHEPEMARDELLFLVEDCRGFLEAYNLLAELALEENDFNLARGHFGFGYESGMAALPEGFRGLLPATEGYNPHFFLAGRGLARCLIKKGDVRKGREVLEQLAKFDPEEPNVKALLAELPAPPPRPGKRPTGQRSPKRPKS
jgi:hypothetical protein